MVSRVGADISSKLAALVEAKRVDEYKFLKVLKEIQAGEETGLDIEFWAQTEKKREKFLKSATRETLEAMKYDWSLNGRPKQLSIFDVPNRTTVLFPGRGWGKTRTLSEYVRWRWKTGKMKRGMLIANTTREIESFNIEGDSGLMEVHPNHERPQWNQKKQRLTWPDGAVMLYRSGEKPRTIRGNNSDTVVIDELAAMQYQDNVMMQSDMIARIGNDPKILIATTPQGTDTIKELVEDPLVHKIWGSTFENSALDNSYHFNVFRKYAHTRLGRQELFGEILLGIDGALWEAKDFDVRIEPSECKIDDFKRIVVGVDPHGGGNKDKTGEKASEVGIVVCGEMNHPEHGDIIVILEDCSDSLSPHHWGKRVVSKFQEYGADKVIAEVNFGGDMVTEIIHNHGRKIPVKVVRASRGMGKHVRAEPVADLYKQKKIFHLQKTDSYGIQESKLVEDQLLQFTVDGYQGKGSPDRADALIWGVHELAIAEKEKIKTFWFG